MSDNDCCSTPTIVVPPALKTAPRRVHTVAIVGPPNSGKSTLFNQLTGLRQKVANYPGVTVEHHVGRVRLTHNTDVELIDLPGVYSLDPRSEDERVSRDVLVGDVPQIFRPGQLYGGILIAGLLIYWGLLTLSRIGSNSAAWVAILFVAVVRWLVIYFNWQTFAVNQWQIEPALHSLPRPFSGSSSRASREETAELGRNTDE